MDAERARSFGAEADAYDRTRPGYPPAAVDLLAAGVTDAVDVGCGTGKLSRLLADRGCRVVGVEHDERMAAVARRHGIDVDVARFEEWDDRGRRFDLVASAQAWHWIDPVLGAHRAGEVLRPGGRLAVVWNLGTHDAVTRARLDAVYAEHAPELAGSAALGVRVGADAGRPLAGVDGTGLFGPQQRHEVAWEQRWTVEEWVAQLRTHSDHAALPAERRERLLDAVAGALGPSGGVTIAFTTLCILATRVGAVPPGTGAAVP